jgi:hypothetical protein
MRRNPYVSYFKQGDHICLFYRDTEEQLATLVPYVRVGLARRERCFCVQEADTSERLLNALQDTGIDTTAQIRSRALVLLALEEVYFADEQFDPDAMATLLASAIEESVRMGFSGFRAAGEMQWCLTGRKGCERLVEYEAMMERFYPGRPAVGLCQYHAARFTPAKLREVLKVHRMALLASDDSAHHSAMRLRSDAMFGDVVFDPRRTSTFHYVLQHDNSSEIIAVGQEESFDAAVTAVKSYFRQYAAA